MPFRKYLLIDSVDSAQILALNFFCLYPVYCVSLQKGQKFGHLLSEKINPSNFNHCNSLLIQPFFLRSNKICHPENFSYLARGYLTCGIFVQLTENKSLPSRYLFSIKAM